MFQIDLYENKLKQLQEANVQIQVENSTLQSQSTSLLSQINSLQTTNVTLETAKRRVSKIVLLDGMLTTGNSSSFQGVIHVKY